VHTAATFAKKPVRSAPSVRLKLIVFTDTIVKNRTLFGELQKKAEDILVTQGNAFKLDVTVFSTDISYRERFYLESQVQEFLDLARKQTTIAADTLPVINAVTTGSDFHGIAVGQRVVLIDTEHPNPDRSTLLHEIGHCAGLPHSGEPVSASKGSRAAPIDTGTPDNVMFAPKSWLQRATLTITQGEFLAKAFFATKI
jgi:hypothetical protein